MAEAVRDHHAAPRRRRAPQAQASPQRSRRARPRRRRRPRRRPPAGRARRRAAAARTRATLTVPVPAPPSSMSEVARQPLAPRQPGARRAARRIAVAQAPLDVGHARARRRWRAPRRRRLPSGCAAISSRPSRAWRTGWCRARSTTSARRPASHLVEAAARRASCARMRAAPRRPGWRRRMGNARWVQPAIYFHRVMLTRVPSPGCGVDIELVDQPLAAGQAQAHAAAGGPAVGQRQPGRRCPGPCPRNAGAGPARPVVLDELPAHLAAAAVDQRVARQLAGRGDHLGLVDQRELELLATACAPSAGWSRCSAPIASGIAPAAFSHPRCVLLGAAAQQLHAALDIERGAARLRATGRVRRA